MRMQSVDGNLNGAVSAIEADERAVGALFAEEAAAKRGGLRSGVVQLFKEYAPAVRAFLLRRLGNREDAQEATQEVFLHLWRQECKGRLESGARAYLFAAADNMAKDWRRRAKARASDRHEPLGQREFTAPIPDCADVAHWRGALKTIVECMQELSPDTQRIFLLYHGSRLSYTEVAMQLGITARTVERHMAQAIAHCKERLKAYL